MVSRFASSVLIPFASQGTVRVRVKRDQNPDWEFATEKQDTRLEEAKEERESVLFLLLHPAAQMRQSDSPIGPAVTPQNSGSLIVLPGLRRGP